MPEPRVSVVLPVRDGGALLGELLDALAVQELPGGHEIVAIDTSSRDGSYERLLAAGARVERIEPGGFDHGATRNRGVQMARGPYVVFLSQDAVPAGAGFLAAITGPLDGDPRVAGVTARQVPRPGADPLTRRDLAGWVAAGEAPRVVFRDPGFDHLPPLERYRLSVFDNAASAARRDLLLAHPFAPSRFGEDVEWGARMLSLGHGLAYEPRAVVAHSHRRSARALYRRNYLGHRLLFRLFGLQTIGGRPHLVRAVLGTLLSDARTLAAGGGAAREWLAWPAQALLSAYGQYRGVRDELRGRAYPRWA
jgi:rhamnosyltransferase